MQVFVYEYFTGGGVSKLSPDGVAGSLLKEAAAMVKAVTEDFAALPMVRVVTTRDSRWPAFPAADCEVVEIGDGQSDLETFARLSVESDWTVLIAPEMGGALLARAQLVEENGGRLLSPSSKFICIAADKQLTAEAMLCAGVAIPRGIVWRHGDSMEAVSYPAVMKPLDGCGSQYVRRLNYDAPLLNSATDCWRIEEYVSGMATSVSILCGPKQNWPLAACEQHLSDDGRFSYLGGRLPLTPELDSRARSLARRAVQALPPTIGYVGIDLVLGDAADGGGDCVIEVNPRLTTSYVGLRCASRTNLAAAMLAAAWGEEPVLCFKNSPVEFTAAGDVHPS